MVAASSAAIPQPSSSSKPRSKSPLCVCGGGDRGGTAGEGGRKRGQTGMRAGGCSCGWVWVWAAVLHLFRRGGGRAGLERGEGEGEGCVTVGGTADPNGRPYVCMHVSSSSSWAGHRVMHAGVRCPMHRQDSIAAAKKRGAAGGNAKLCNTPIRSATCLCPSPVPPLPPPSPGVHQLGGNSA